MKKILLLFLLLTSCVKYDYLDDGKSMYDCGIIIGGERVGSYYYLWVDFPDGEFWYEVTEKAYYDYKILDEICFDTIRWD